VPKRYNSLSYFPRFADAIKGLRGEIPRLYRHDAESLSWVLTYLSVSMVKNGEGKNCTMIWDPLRAWFADWQICHSIKLGFEWKLYGDINTVFAYPNTRILAQDLCSCWLDRYRRQFRNPTAVPTDGPSFLGRELGIAYAKKGPPYVEDDDDTVFHKILVLHENPLALAGLRGTLIEMFRGYRGIDWSD
jgi:hypothetical protein